VSTTSVAVRALDAVPVRRLLRRLGRWTGTLVLVHHRIGDPARSPLHPALFSATEEGLAAQLDVLAREADVVDASEVAAPATRRGRRVAITFDDGYRDTAEVAWPLLAARGLPATVFLSTGFLDRPRLSWWDELAWIAGAAGWPSDVRERLCARYSALPADDAEAFLERVACASLVGRAPRAVADDVWMTWDDARRIHAAGMTVGGHTVDHPVLSRVDDDRLAAEIDGCRAALRRELGIPMELFSHPLGRAADVDDRARGPLERAGVRLAFECAGGVAHPDRHDRLRVPRACAPPAGHDGAARCRAAVALPGVFARC
jgi:peptidoglycan/xylan/chitin deacetylase (PgdA/CDA1 family)